MVSSASAAHGRSSTAYALYRASVSDHSLAPPARCRSQKKLATLPSQHHTKGTVEFAWQPQGSFLATCGANRIVNIFNRQGEAKAEIPLDGQGRCLQMGWDQDGEMLAVLQDGSPIVKLWDANQNNSMELDTGMKDLTLISWAVAGPQLAIGNAKGDLVVYNKKTLKKQLIRGKHTKKILCGAWNSQNMLALGSEDRQVTVSNADGDTLHQNTLKHVPGDVQFAAWRKGGGGGNDGPPAAGSETKDTTMSVVLGGRSLLLYDVSALDRTPVELAFQAKYGNLITYRWFGDGYIALGFESGYLVVMSSSEMAEELFSQKLHDGAHHHTARYIGPPHATLAHCTLHFTAHHLSCRLRQGGSRHSRSRRCCCAAPRARATRSRSSTLPTSTGSCPTSRSCSTTTAASSRTWRGPTTARSSPSRPTGPAVAAPLPPPSSLPSPSLSRGTPPHTPPLSLSRGSPAPSLALAGPGPLPLPAPCSLAQPAPACPRLRLPPFPHPAPPFLLTLLSPGEQRLRVQLPRVPARAGRGPRHALHLPHLAARAVGPPRATRHAPRHAASRRAAPRRASLPHATRRACHAARLACVVAPRRSARRPPTTGTARSRSGSRWSRRLWRSGRATRRSA